MCNKFVDAGDMVIEEQHLAIFDTHAPAFATSMSY
jgi:hypothetical protein